MSSTCPNRLLGRLFRRSRRAPERPERDRSEHPATGHDPADGAATRAERARSEAQRWLAMREREFARRLEERHGDERSLIDAG